MNEKYITYRKLLKDLERIPPLSKMEERVKRELRKTLEILDDLESGRIEIDEAKDRYDKVLKEFQK